MSSSTQAAVQTPLVGIVGRDGAYGRWLAGFFESVMGLKVQGIDVGNDTPAARSALVRECQVLLFSTPIAETPSLIREYAALLPAGGPVPLWLDVASLKAASCAALAEAPVESVGLHPMCAPPPLADLRGRVLVVCPQRLAHWQVWFDELLARLQARVVVLKAERHDALMALVQAGVHAGWLAQAQLWAQAVPELTQNSLNQNSVCQDGQGGLEDLLAVRTPSFALAEAATARLLAGNAALYADIQLQNPQAPAVLRRLAAAMQQLADTVARGDRDTLMQQFLAGPKQTLGEAALVSGNQAFERLSHLLADLDEPHPIVLAITADRPGALADVLAAFAARRINLRAIQSVRTPEGGIRFHLCLDRTAEDAGVQRVLAGLRAQGLIA